MILKRLYEDEVFTCMYLSAGAHTVHTHTYTHMYIHTYTHKYIHTHAHVHTHTGCTYHAVDQTEHPEDGLLDERG